MATFNVTTTNFKTGTVAYTIRNKVGDLISKTIIPGIQNKNAKFKAISVNYLNNKPIQVLAKGRGKNARTLQSELGKRGWVKSSLYQNENQSEIANTAKCIISDAGDSIRIADNTGHTICTHNAYETQNGLQTFSGHWQNGREVQNIYTFNDCQTNTVEIRGFSPKHNQVDSVPTCTIKSRIG